MGVVEDKHVVELPLERAWRIAKRSHDLIPRLMPHMFASIDRVEGDGGVGTVYVLTMGPAMPGGRAGKKVKERVDMMDDDTHTLAHTTIEGGDPRYSSFTSCISYAPGPYRNSTIRTWTAKYTPAEGTAPPPPDHMKKLTQTITEAIHNYAAEHPNYCA